MKKNTHIPPKFLTKFYFFLILFALTTLLLIVVGVKYFLQKEEYIEVEMITTGGEWWWGTPNPYYWNILPVDKGAIEYDIARKPLAEILEVKKYSTDNRTLAWMKVRLKAKKNVRTNSYSFKQNKVEIGKTIAISPNNTSVIGQVVAIEGVGKFGETKTKIITGRLYSIRKELADAILVGDVYKDDQGNVVAEIIDKVVEPAEEVTPTWQGELLLKRNPLVKDVTLKIRMVVQQENNNYFFNYYQLIQEGLAVNLQLTNTSIEPFISKVADE